MKNVLIFAKRPTTAVTDPATFEAEMALDTKLNNWIAHIMATGRDYSTGDFHAPIGPNVPTTMKAGTVYHLWLSMGLLIHKSGFNDLRHYIKMPLTWLDEVHSTRPVFTPIEGSEEMVEGTENVLNREALKDLIKVGNTEALYRITDSNYSTLKALLVPTVGQPTNLVAEDKLDLWIIANAPTPIEEV